MVRTEEEGGSAGVTEEAKAGRSFHVLVLAWRKGVECHIGQSGEIVGCPN
jgi:hypothetical protein